MRAIRWRPRRRASIQKAYASDWRRFCDFCEACNVEALPVHPDVVALFVHVEAEAGIAPVTTGRRIATITHHHRDAGLASPSARDGAGVIAAMLAGVRRKYARKKEQKSPVQAECAAPFFTHVKPLSEQFGFRNWKGQTVRTVFSSAAIGE